LVIVAIHRSPGNSARRGAKLSDRLERHTGTALVGGGEFGIGSIDGGREHNQVTLDAAGSTGTSQVRGMYSDAEPAIPSKLLPRTLHKSGSRSLT